LSNDLNLVSVSLCIVTQILYLPLS
jgi:hypothetical protein